MNIEPNYKNIIEDLDRFTRLLPVHSDDQALMVLKGHLLVEELIWKIIVETLPNPDELSAVRFGFEHSLAIARAASNKKAPVWIWTCCLKLNSIRNKLSHKIEPDGVENHVRDFISMIENNSNIKSLPKDVGQTKQLAWGVAMLYFSISATIHADPFVLIEATAGKLK